MFLKLGELGVTGKVWRIIKDSYTDLKCNVRLNGICSGPVPVQRGVRQGGVLSTLLYLAYINDLLLELQSSQRSANIFSLKGGNPTLADDITIMAVSPNNLQRLLDIVYVYAQTWLSEISTSK